MKNQWPFWLFMIVIIVVVIIAINYRGTDDVVSLGDIFPEQQGGLEYEYHTGGNDDAKRDVVEPAQKVQELVKEDAVRSVESMNVAEEKPESKMVEPKAAEVVKGVYTIQILSSKDKGATQNALEKVKLQDLDQAYIQEKDLGEKGVWYRIYVGQFTTMNQAQQVLPKVKEKYGTAFITKL